MSKLPDAEDTLSPPPGSTPSEMFPVLTSAQQARVLAHGRRRSVEQDEIVVELNEHITKVFVVVSGQLHILQVSNDQSLLAVARSRSHLLGRNTSIFTPPSDKKRLLEPAKGVFVKSKAEFIIYKALEKSGLKFKYEEELSLSNRSYVIHPDFTIFLDKKKKIFWEHLGMLDVRKYYRDWQRRKVDYEDHKFFEMVVTTDDLEGLRDESLERVIQDIKALKLKKSKGNRFSNQHYTLY